MTDDSVELSALRPGLVEIVFPWFLRLAAIYSLALGAFYWVRLIGFYPGTLWRFDTMPVEWQVASVCLAALFPFAGIGLWMTASWGPVVWFICAATETVMYAGFPEIFGRHDLLVASHLVVVLIYVAFRLVLFFQRRKPQP